MSLPLLPRGATSASYPDSGVTAPTVHTVGRATACGSEISRTTGESANATVVGVSGAPAERTSGTVTNRQTPAANDWPNGRASPMASRPDAI